jgi:oxygen-independent coproporphyrinogen-3 oxidase
MAGIYIHIPFCKQACHYCDFHFSTTSKNRDRMVDALIRELELRRYEADEVVETIYFGGGTPSVLSDDDLSRIIENVGRFYEVSTDAEITLEANPDDLGGGRLKALAKGRINRLSIGIQSFFESDLKMMNRAHNAEEAKQCLQEARSLFDNISIDLIYGMPGMSNAQWIANIEMALTYDIPHISSYALTVEPRTPLKKMIETGRIGAPSDEEAHEHFVILTQKLAKAGYLHYELSNFARPGYFSRNNSAYWLGKKYIGIGPSAHSYDGKTRSWNVANNSLYIKSINQNILPSEKETLSKADVFNEYIMTGLRTIWGVNLERIAVEFGDDYLEHLRSSAEPHLHEGRLTVNENTLKTTDSGKFLTDGIASDLFLVNLD